MRVPIILSVLVIVGTIALKIIVSLVLHSISHGIIQVP